MNATIWKFPIRVAARQVVRMPEGSRVLSVQRQGGSPCAWAMVNPSAPSAPVEILCFGTGHPVGPVGAFLGTVQSEGGGELVFHFFLAEGARHEPK